MSEYFDIKDIVSWKDRNTVKIGDEGYFSDSIADFDDLIHDNEIGCLNAIDDDDAFCFAYGDENYDVICNRSFFLPKDKVKTDKEKKWRPFRSAEEFASHFGYENCRSMVGKETLLIRYKSEPKEESYYLVTGFEVDCLNHEKDKLVFGESWYSFTYLFDQCEIQKDGKWVPFGVVEE